MRCCLRSGHVTIFHLEVRRLPARERRRLDGADREEDRREDGRLLERALESEDGRHIRRRIQHGVPHFSEEHARDGEHGDAAVLQFSLAVLDHFGRAGALGEAEGVEVEARARDARDLVAREAVGELGGGRVLERRDVELRRGLRRGRRDERGRGGGEGEGRDELHGCCLLLVPARGRGGQSWCLVASRRSSRGEVKFAAVAVGAREQRAARCDGPHTAVCSRSVRRHRIVPLRCSTCIVWHQCGCFAAVSLKAELRAAFCALSSLSLPLKLF